MSTAGRVAKNTLFLYAKMVITMFISLYTTRLILQALGAEDFGIFSIVGGAIAMLGFLNAAMASATQRFMSYTEGEGDKEKQKRIFNISFVLHTAIGLLMGLVLTAAGWLFFHGILNISPARVEAAQVVYGSLIVSTVFTVMSVPYEAVLNARENMLYYSIVGVIESLLKLVVALIVVRTTGDKLISYGILMAGIPLVTLTIMRIYCHRKYEECIIAPRKYWDKRLMKEMRSFAGWNLMNTTVIMISANGQGVILNSFFGTIVNTAQGIAGQLNGQLQVLASGMLKALNPTMGKSAGANNHELLIMSTNIGAKYATTLFLILATPIFLEAPFFLKIWLGKTPEWVVVFLRFQLVKSFVEFQFLTVMGYLNVLGQIKKLNFWSITFNILQLPCAYIVFQLDAPPYFIYIITILFGNLLVYITAMRIAQKLYNFSVKDYIFQVTIPITYLIISVVTSHYLLEYMFPLVSPVNRTLFALLMMTIAIYMVIFTSTEKGQMKVYLLNRIKSV